MVDDETLFRTMEVAAETGALVMVHAENGDAIDVLVKEALAEGKTEPIWHACTRPPDHRGGGDEPRDPARPRRRRARSTSSMSPARRRSSRSPAPAPRAGSACGETCTQYLFIDETALSSRASRARKYVYTPPPRPKENQEHLWHALANGRALGRLDRPLPLQLGRPEDARQGRLLEDPERRPGDREPAPHALPLRRARGPHLAEPVRRARLDERCEVVRPLPAQGHDRARAPTPTSSSGIRRSASRSRPRRTTRTSTTTCSRAPRSSARRRSCSYAARSIVEGDELVAQPGAGQFVRRARFGEELTPATAVAG